MTKVIELLEKQIKEDIQPGRVMEAASLRNPLLEILDIIKGLEKENQELKLAITQLKK